MRCPNVALYVYLSQRQIKHFNGRTDEQCQRDNIKNTIHESDETRRGHGGSGGDVVKDLRHGRDEDKDLGLEDKDKALWSEDNDKDKDLWPEDKLKDKDL